MARLIKLEESGVLDGMKEGEGRAWASYGR
jgi:hypothetical protein